MKQELERISFRKYVELEDRQLYDYAMEYSKILNKPNDLFNIGPFTNFSFGQVKDLQTTFSNGVDFVEMLNFVCDFKKMELKKVAEYEFFELCKFRSFVKSELEKIERIESKLMYSASSLDQAAGIDKLEQFGVGIQIDALAGGDVLKWKAVRQLDYMTGFFKLYMDKTRDEVSAAKNKLNKPKK